MKFNLVIEVDSGTDLPGCLSEGDTPKEAIENINEAIVGCLRSRLKVAGEQIKIPSFKRRICMSIDATTAYG